MPDDDDEVVEGGVADVVEDGVDGVDDSVMGEGVSTVWDLEMLFKRFLCILIFFFVICNQSSFLGLSE